MNVVATFQRDFAQALIAPDAQGSSLPSTFAMQRGFAVHRNNVMVGCIDALASNFPTVARLVGDAFFRAMAAEFARRELPVRPSLLDYGHEFADFLRAFPPVASLSYLADVARVDRWWLEAHCAADAPLLSAADLARRDAASLDGLQLRLHPSVRFGWFDQPIFSIWHRNRDATPRPTEELVWRSEGVLLVRSRDDVVAHEIGAAAWGLLAACASHLTLADATAAALGCDAVADFTAPFAQLIHAGAFAALEE